jgi:uncharacterized membrane protein
MAPGGSPPAPRPPRLAFVDALRGLAVSLMVVNHTARWWLAPAVGLGRQPLIYATMALAGPTFLFLVGVSLALGYHRAAVIEGRPFATVAGRNVRRAAAILAAGAVVNVLVFPEDVLGARVLVSIAFMILVATPLLPALRSRPGRAALLALAPALYVAFVWCLPALAAWSRLHPLRAAVLFREFPVFPWLALVLLGLVAGWTEATARDRWRRDRWYAGLGAAGALVLLGIAALAPGRAGGRGPGLAGDLTLNDYWTAGPITAAALTAAILVLLALAYATIERGGWRAGPLVGLGRAALLVYVVHLVVVAPLGARAGGVVLRGWGPYLLATAWLLAGLGLLAAGWLLVRPRLRALARAAGAAAGLAP